MIYYISLLLVRFTAFIYCNTTVTGNENIPKKGGCILACNHRSNLDPFIMGVTTYRFLNFMAKEELFKTKFLNWYYHQVGAFPIKRDVSDFRGLREAIRRLKGGRILVLFPEGTRGMGERVKKINPGVGFLIRASGVPVLPVHLTDTDKVLPSGAKWFKRHRVKINIGKPLQFSEELSNSEIAISVMDKIQDLGDSV